MNNIILHQTYKNNLPSKYDKYVSTWTKHNFDRKFYSDSDLETIIKKYTPEWNPSNFRPFVANNDIDYDKAGQKRIVDVSKSGKIK